MASLPRISLLLVLFVAGAAQAQEAGRFVLIDEPVAQDLYAAGREVDVRAPVTGDLVAAGRSVRIDGDVSEDLIAAGRNVEVDSDIGDDVRLAGRSVSISNGVAGHGVIAGQEVRLEPDSRIADWAWIVGTEVEVLGSIGGDLRAFGNEIEIDGRIDGDVEIAGSELRIGDQAVIGGDLTWRSEDEPKIAAGAVIQGDIIEGLPLDDFEDEDDGVGENLFALICVIVAACVLSSLFGTRCDGCAKTAREKPWTNLGIGLAVLVGMPVLAGLLFATGIGALLGGLVLASYPVVLLLGGLTGIIVLSRIGLARFGGDGGSRWKDWGSIAAVSLIIGLLYVVPPVGVFAASLILLLGIGVLWVEGVRLCRA